MQVRITPAVATVLELFLTTNPDPVYGYQIMTTTGFSSGKVYRILARLEGAGWLLRNSNTTNDPPHPGLPRVTYTLQPDAVMLLKQAIDDRNSGEHVHRRRKHITVTAMDPAPTPPLPGGAS